MNPGTDWIEQGRRLLETLRSSAEASDGEHGSDCRWCPVCQTAAVLRGERPEVTAALADVLATTASVLRDLAGEPVRPGGPAPGPDAAGPQDDRDGDSGPAAVQRIDIA